MAQQHSVLGIDIAKRVFHTVGMDDAGHVVLRKRMARGALLHFIATPPPALMGMEACGGAPTTERGAFVSMATRYG